MVREAITDAVEDGELGRGHPTTPRIALRSIQARHGVGAIGGITSSRCTNEEVFVVQKMVRAAFGNNNVDTCARVCHSPTGFGLKQTFGTSAGTQDFKSVEQLLTSWSSSARTRPRRTRSSRRRMKRRLREGAKLDRDRPAPDRPRALTSRRGESTTCS